MTENSTQTENYLKAIWNAAEWSTQPVTVSVLAARLGLAASSVSEAVRKLTARGLVTHAPYSAIALSAEGERIAVAMVRKHRVIETFLVEELGYAWDEVHDEAEVLEHALSDRLLDAIDAQLGYPGRDPHGDVIPAADGTLRRPAAVRLDEAPHGFEGVIVRISDRDPDVLRVVDRLGLALDDAVTVEPADGVGAGVGVRRRGGSVVVLAPAVAGALWIAPHNATPARSR